MEINFKIERRVKLRIGDGLLLLGVFVNLLFMIICGYNMWKPILFYRDKRIVLSVFLIVLVIRVLLYFLDTAIWRICGEEYVELNTDGITYIKKKRLIKQKIHIGIKNIISIKRNVSKTKFITSNIEDDIGKVQIAFIRYFLGVRIIDQIDVGCQFSDCEVDRLLSAYSNIKASKTESHL